MTLADQELWWLTRLLRPIEGLVCVAQIPWVPTDQDSLEIDPIQDTVEIDLDDLVGWGDQHGKVNLHRTMGVRQSAVATQDVVGPFFMDSVIEEERFDEQTFSAPHADLDRALDVAILSGEPEQGRLYAWRSGDIQDR